jgi:hypothetical protein
MSWLSELSHDHDRFAPFVTLAVGTMASLVALAASLAATVIGWRQGNAARRAAEAANTSAEAATKNAEAAILSARIAGHREVAKLRIGWMETLRNTLAEYHATLMTLEDGNNDADDEMLKERHRMARDKLVLLGTQLDLLLNQDNIAQKELWDITDRIYNMDTSEERQNEDKPLVEAARKVLKQEWERVKKEMREGDFQS